MRDHKRPSEREFERIKESAEKWYAKVDAVECPYLGSPVTFNRKGMAHLRYRKNGYARDWIDQIARFKHIRFAQRILERSKTLQEYREARSFEDKKAGGRRERVLEIVVYYGFVAIIKDEYGYKRFKVIVKQVAHGAPYFWSIIPAWKIHKGLRLFSGNPEED